jgi:hypothetical protein
MSNIRPGLCKEGVTSPSPFGSMPCEKICNAYTIDPVKRTGLWVNGLVNDPIMTRGGYDDCHPPMLWGFAHNSGYLTPTWAPW